MFDDLLKEILGSDCRQMASRPIPGRADVHVGPIVRKAGEPDKALISSAVTVLEQLVVG